MLTLLMYVGRVGTITLAASLALGEHRMLLPLSGGTPNCWLNCCFQSNFRSPKATVWWSSGLALWQLGGALADTPWP